MNIHGWNRNCDNAARSYQNIRLSNSSITTIPSTKMFPVSVRFELYHEQREEAQQSIERSLESFQVELRRSYQDLTNLRTFRWNSPQCGTR